MILGRPYMDSQTPRNIPTNRNQLCLLVEPYIGRTFVGIELLSTESRG